MANHAENMHTGHRERLRERFRQNGLEGFFDHEILEMLLFYAVKRGDTNALAHALLREYGSLQDVLRTDPESLCRVKGIGESVAYFLHFTAAFHDYVEQSRMCGLSLGSVENRCLYFRSKLACCTDENIMAACLDDRLKVIRCFTAAKGAPGAVQIEMQTFVREILLSHCRSVLLAHNHLTGRASPSVEDVHNTNAIAGLLKKLDIELLDHIIVTPEDTCSMRKAGAYDPDML